MVQPSEVKDEVKNNEVPERGKSAKERKVEENKPKEEKLSIIGKFKRLLRDREVKRMMIEQNKKRQEIFNKIRDLKELMNFIDQNLGNRKQKKVFWKKFIEEGSVRNSVINDLMRRYQ